VQKASFHRLLEDTELMRCNRKKLAAILGVDVKTIDTMVRKGMPYVSRPEGNKRFWVFDTRAVLKWTIRGDFDEQMKQARTRLWQAKAGIKWLEYGKRLGVMVEADEIDRHVLGGDTIVKSRLMALPDRMAHILASESDPAKIEQLLDKEIGDVLDQLNKPWNERG
jgi:phage terminase Nu1 subunit (DNA packaging protein)